jgi:hypothetical protein
MTTPTDTSIAVAVKTNGEIIENDKFLQLSEVRKQQIRDYVGDVIGGMTDTIDEMTKGSSAAKQFVLLDVSYSYLQYRDEQRATNPNHTQTLKDEAGAVASTVIKYLSGFLATKAVGAIVLSAAAPTAATVVGAVAIGFASGKFYDSILKDDVNTIVDRFWPDESSKSGSVFLSDTKLEYTPNPATTLSSSQAQQKALELLTNLSSGKILNQSFIPEKITINSSDNSSTNQPRSFDLNFSKSLTDLLSKAGLNTNLQSYSDAILNFSVPDGKGGTISVAAIPEFVDAGVSNLLGLLKSSINSLFADSHTISSYLQSSLNSLSSAERPAPVRRVDPLTLDLDSDGVELINVTQSKAFFDLDIIQNQDGTFTSDGVKEQVGWIKADDGLLTLDKNNNGTIDNILELFGKQTKTGTEELREYDGNNDGIISDQDAIFSQLKLWQDLNGNGISEAWELKSFSDFRIKSINLNSLTTLNQIQESNLIISQGTFTKTITNTDGTSSDITSNYANLDLAVNQTNSASYSYTDPAGNVIGDYDLNLEVLALPLSRGYGNLKPWHMAMSNDETLLNISEKL